MSKCVMFTLDLILIHFIAPLKKEEKDNLIKTVSPSSPVFYYQFSE